MGADLRRCWRLPAEGAVVSVEVILPRSIEELVMIIQSNRPTTALRRRMIEDMSARNLGRHSRRSHLYSCERFAGFLERSPDTATADIRWTMSVIVSLSSALPPTSDIPGEAGNVSS